MKRRALLVALVTAVAGFALLQVYLRRLRDEIAGGALMAVLTAATDIPSGKPISADMLAVRMLPQAYLDKRHIRKLDAAKLIGARLASAVDASDALLWTDLALSPKRRDLSALVKEGMRALTVGGENSTFDGLLRAGDRVDVLFTSRGAGPLSAHGGDSTVTLLQNLLVLAVFGDTGEGRAAGTPQGRAVTLSVSAEQAQLLTHSEGMGKIRLVLRAPEDVVLVQGLPPTLAADIVEEARRERFQSHRARASGEVIEHVQ